MSLNNSGTEPKEHYSPGYGAELVSSFEARCVNIEARFFFPHLRAGMHLLDCGCGPGTITSGLARIVNPGTVTAIDIEAKQVEHAAVKAREQGITNVRFQTASIYQLPFPDASFDAAFAHAVLQHLKDPDTALREIFRVLKPGGLVGVRDDDQGGMVLWPADPQMDRVVELLKQIMRKSGGDPFVGRRHRALLHRAGFVRVQGSATAECDGTLESSSKRGNLAAALLEHIATEVVESGLATRNELKDLSETCKAWGRHPDAYDAIIWCEAVAWKP